MPIWLWSLNSARYWIVPGGSSGRHATARPNSGSGCEHRAKGHAEGPATLGRAAGTVELAWSDCLSAHLCPSQRT